MSTVVAWATENDLPDSCSDAAVEPDTLAKALDFASVVMYRLSGSRWPGIFSDTFWPFAWGSCWHRACMGGSYDVPHVRIELPGHPVQSITQIKVQGQVIDPAQYRVVDHRWLIATRRDNVTQQSWPCWNDIARNANDVTDVFTIQYKWGQTPPSEWVTAAAILGWEFALAWTPSCASKCRLPKRVLSMSSNGLNVSVIDPLTMFDKGRTGIPEIDLLLTADQVGAKRHTAFLDPTRRNRHARQTS